MDRMADKIILYHTGFSEIRVPDVHMGRKNADFGQGFYLSSDLSFSKRWARVRKGMDTYINTYELDTAGLSVRRLGCDEEWFEYIFGNRNGRPDTMAGIDVIIGPIANDIIFDLYGITTSGYLTAAQSLQILSAGPEYTQVVLKTDQAAAALKFLSSEILDERDIRAERELVQREEEAYQEEFARMLLETDGGIHTI